MAGFVPLTLIPRGANNGAKTSGQSPLRCASEIFVPFLPQMADGMTMHDVGDLVGQHGGELSLILQAC